ncbi:MAG: HAD hydrolase-like protein [Verrucomicrobiae bacterium]|nr:HAD hydrolase-like protein [Verrucomicrobiae bacterium]
MDRLGVDARDALYIGDTVHDMRAAAGAGVPRCAVLWGTGISPMASRCALPRR